MSQSAASAPSYGAAGTQGSRAAGTGKSMPTPSQYMQQNPNAQVTPASPQLTQQMATAMQGLGGKSGKGPPGYGQGPPGAPPQVPPGTPPPQAAPPMAQGTPRGAMAPAMPAQGIPAQPINPMQRQATMANMLRRRYGR
jgi:hypothetical protein